MVYLVVVDGEVIATLDGKDFNLGQGDVETVWRAVSQRSSRIPTLRGDGRAIRSVLDKLIAKII